jgi:hypothetical protein
MVRLYRHMEGKMYKRLAKKYQDLGWFAILSIIIIVGGNGRSLAGTSSTLSKHQFMQCQTSLKHFSAHLEIRKDDTHQAYYDDLYNQIQYFLKSMDNLPISPSQLVKCENLLKALQDIVGTPVSTPDLEPMPSTDSLNDGSLTKPALEKHRRPLPKNVHVRYVCEDHKKREKNLKDTVEFEELTSYPNPALSRLRRGVSGEPKDIEK